MSEEDASEAAVVGDVSVLSHSTGADVFPHELRTERREKHPVLPIDSQATGARQRPDGASDKLGGSRQVVRRASTTEEVTLIRAITARSCLVPLHTKTLFWPVVAHLVHVQTPLAALQLQPRAKRAADGVTEPVRAIGRAELHTEWGNLLLAPAQPNSWLTSSLPGYLASHVSAGSWASCNSQEELAAEADVFPLRACCS